MSGRLTFSVELADLHSSWSVKEAAYKALYPTVKATWKDLAYQSYANGQKPTLVFTETLEADKGSKVGPIHVSVSHDGEYVVSQVLVEGTQDFTFKHSTH